MKNQNFKLAWCIVPHGSWVKQRLKREGGIIKEAKVECRDVESASDNRIRTKLIVNLKYIDITSFLNDAYNLFNKKVTAYLKEFNALKVNSDLVAEFTI